LDIFSFEGELDFKIFSLSRFCLESLKLWKSFLWVSIIEFLILFLGLLLFIILFGMFSFSKFVVDSRRIFSSFKDYNLMLTQTVVNESFNVGLFYYQISFLSHLSFS